MGEYMRKAQTFPATQRKQLMKLFYDVANGIKPNDKWSNDELNSFNEEFGKVLELSGNWGADDKWFGNDAQPEMVLALRTRFLEAAKLQNLTYPEALKLLKEDAYYKKLFEKRSQEMAARFIE